MTHLKPTKPPIYRISAPHKKLISFPIQTYHIEQKHKFSSFIVKLYPEFQECVFVPQIGYHHIIFKFLRRKDRSGLEFAYTTSQGKLTTLVCRTNIHFFFFFFSFGIPISCSFAYRAYLLKNNISFSFGIYTSFCSVAYTTLQGELIAFVHKTDIPSSFEILFSCSFDLL